MEHTEVCDKVASTRQLGQVRRGGRSDAVALLAADVVITAEAVRQTSGKSLNRRHGVISEGQGEGHGLGSCRRTGSASRRRQ